MKFKTKIEAVPVVAKSNISTKDSTKVYYQASVAVADEVNSFGVLDNGVLAKLKQKMFQPCKITLEITHTEKYGTYMRIVECE